jgi:hypothetical protein
MSSLFKTTKYVNFKNDTDLPIMIDSWVDGSNSLKCIKILPRETRLIHSSVGEWHVNSMFPESEDWTSWMNLGLKWYVNLGKFRSDPCATGNYAWMEWEHIFDCVYSECDPVIEPKTQIPVTGLITYTFKGLPKPSN